ncbi:MAG: hypothetical protein K0S09_1910 [Sphingobacteriaceae bacterium]|nr:hypothetical protein [Sphingobacteriaceae bacterium]
MEKNHSELRKSFERGVKIKVYYRELKAQDYKVLKSYGAELVQVEGLHTKLYFNESEAIVSSMNFYEYSDLNSVDLALQYSDRESYDKLYSYFQRYIATIGDDRSIPFDVEEDLERLRDALLTQFVGANITGTSYLFSKDIVPPFHVMIHSDHLRLKYPIKGIDKVLMDNLDAKLAPKSFKIAPFADGKGICDWYLDIVNLPAYKLVQLLSDLQFSFKEDVKARMIWY